MSAPYSQRHSRRNRRDYRRKRRISVEQMEIPLKRLKKYLRKELGRAKRFYEKTLEEYKRRMGEQDLQEEGQLSEPDMPNVRFSLFDLMDFTEPQSYGEAVTLLEDLVSDNRFNKRYSITHDPSSGYYLVREK